MSDDDVLKQESSYLMIEPYREFLKAEGVPLIEAYSVECPTVLLEPWPRLGGRGAYVHLTGRGDHSSVYIAEIDPGGELKPERHMHDEQIHVVKGHGATTVELPSGAQHTFEWGPSSVFSIPMNAPHQHFNGSGTEPARFAAVTDLPLWLNLAHDPDFIYDNPWVFNSRFGEERYFQGEGVYRPAMAGYHQWETNFVPDLVHFQLPEWKERGAGGNSIRFTLGDSNMHCHMSEFPSGTYKKGHCHNAGAHIFLVSGHGYSLLWLEGQNPVDTIRVDWKAGTLFAPPDGPTFHQHFNTSDEAARYLVLGALSGVRYAIGDSDRMKRDMGKQAKSVEEGGRQIEYENEDPRILELFEQETAKHSVQSHMREFIGERAARKTAAG